MSSSRYWELTVEVPEEASEGVTNLVWELGALGVVEEEAPGRPPRLRAFFPKTTFARALEESVRDRRGAARRRSGSRRRRRSRRRRLRDGQRGPQPGLRSRALRPR